MVLVVAFLLFSFGIRLPMPFSVLSLYMGVTLWPSWSPFLGLRLLARVVAPI